MKNIEINILILNWNNRRILSDCIKSILNSKYDNYSITVIDNASTDDSVDYVKSHFENINIIRVPSNLGYALGYNYAFKKIKNTIKDCWFLLLNNDTILNTNTLNVLSQSAIKYGESNIYGCKIINLNNKKIWYAGGKISSITGNAYHNKIDSDDISNSIQIAETDFISGCCMLIKNDLLYKVNGFTPTYNFYYEDVDLCNKAKQLGSKCYYIPSTTILHYISYTLGGRFSILKLFRKIISFIKYLYLNNRTYFFIFYIIINIFLIPYYITNFFIKKITTYED